MMYAHIIRYVYECINYLCWLVFNTNVTQCKKNELKTKNERNEKELTTNACMSGVISGLLFNVKLYSKCGLCTMQAYACFSIQFLLLLLFNFFVSSCSLYTNKQFKHLYTKTKSKKKKNKSLKNLTFNTILDFSRRLQFPSVYIHFFYRCLFSSCFCCHLCIT